MTTPAQPLDTHQRALAINLDSGIYGTFAEIGAGQEVARWFFNLGGAAGTVAQTLSAYDMSFSDAIYGKSGRNVSRERLLAMIAHEYAVLIERQTADRGDKSRFFAFADTVSARIYAGTNECHGWMGIRFQSGPKSPSSQILLHVNLMDGSNLGQQQALGILGVNLIYSAFHESQTTDRLLQSLFADLSLDRVEIDVAELSGPAFDNAADARTLGARLVRGGLANAVLFRPEGSSAEGSVGLAQPSDVLRKRAVVLGRESFQLGDSGDSVDLAAPARKLREESPTLEREPVCLCEMTVRPARGEAPADDDLIRGIGALAARDVPVLLTRFPEAYLLTEYLRRHTTQPIRFVLGASAVVEMLQAVTHADRVGNLFQAMGKLLAQDVRVYVRPVPAARFGEQLARLGLDAATFAPDVSAKTVTIGDLRFAPPERHLFAYLVEAGWLVSL